MTLKLSKKYKTLFVAVFFVLSNLSAQSQTTAGSQGVKFSCEVSRGSVCVTNKLTGEKYFLISDGINCVAINPDGTVELIHKEGIENFLKKIDENSDLQEVLRMVLETRDRPQEALSQEKKGC